ncbi:MAG: TIGR01440 family protein [Clostridiales bacterium]|nr:TIGR01440 family protein [Clostridiales bacterium]
MAEKVTGMSDRTASEHELETVREEAYTAARQLLCEAKLAEGDILVVGCSTSEVEGERIGKYSSPELGQAVWDGISRAAEEDGICLAAQCCEHLNRALIVERKTARVYGLEEVCVVPQPKAGGSFATAAWNSFREPTAVEHIRAHAGMDIGDTLIGMHLKDVAVPVRIAQKVIGEARVVCARTRPKLIGGERAVYVSPGSGKRNGV